MKFRYLLLFMFLCGQQLLAQSLSQAQLSYNEFVKQFSANGECESAYDALYASQKEYLAVLDNSVPGSEEWKTSKARLEKIMPYIYGAAFYYTKKGNQNNTNAFVTAYVDVCMHDAFKDDEIEKGEDYGTFAWMAATNAYNAKQFEKATVYLTACINSGDATRRSDAFYYLAKAYMNIGDKKNAKYILEQGLLYYPENQSMLVSIINLLGESKDDDVALQRYVTRALSYKSSDEGLLNIQAQLYERNKEFENAIAYYDKLRELKPQNLEITRHLAINNYNAGVVCALDADKFELENERKNKKEIKLLREQANAYFEKASENLTLVLYNDPLAVNYAVALAKAYAYLGNEAKLSDINGRIIDLGYQPIAMNADMAFVDYNQMSASANMKNRQIAQLSLAKEEKKPVAQEKQEDVALKADVDIDIPVNAETNTRTFVYVIANEKYKDVADVPNAANDGKVFAEYCNKVLGVPSDNIMIHYNVSFASLINIVDDMKDVAEAVNGDCNVIVYYAGHGIPDESERSAYILPVDSDGKRLRTCYSLNELYADLSSLNADCTTVFLDACFSGASRSNNGEMIMSARSIAIDVDESELDGRLVVFSAASDDQTALAYDEKNHGLFTYFLLKKLKESNGDVTLSELGEYLKEQVGLHSVLKNHKKQTPTVVAGDGFGAEWEALKLKN